MHASSFMRSEALSLRGEGPGDLGTFRTPRAPKPEAFEEDPPYEAPDSSRSVRVVPPFGGR